MLYRLESVFMGNSINDLIESINLNFKSHAEDTPSLDKTLTQLKASLKELSELDQERVLFFKTQIQEGNYRVNSTQIAKKLLNLELA